MKISEILTNYPGNYVGYKLVKTDNYELISANKNKSLLLNDLRGQKNVIVQYVERKSDSLDRNIFPAILYKE